MTQSGNFSIHPRTIQQVKERRETNRKDGEINFSFNQNQKILTYNISVLKYSIFEAWTGSEMA
jgi:hypothetical protein